jgi:hypothetical protein
VIAQYQEQNKFQYNMKSVNQVIPHNVPMFNNLFARLNNLNHNLQHLAK